jgi:hypothetical protein
MSNANSHRIRFTGPGQYLTWMLGFLALVAALIYALQDEIRLAFESNRAINGLIIVVFAIAVLYTFRQTLAIGPAARWVRRLTAANDFSHLPRPPGLIAPMAVLLSETPGHLKLSSASTRSILDAVSSRMAESGEITRYLGRLLIFLGLLGTFWGLLQTVSSVGAAVSALSGSAGGEEDIFKLMKALEEPIKGMGTAFSSSLFGLAGSLVIGFLDLQAGQSQNRFFNEIEDWTATISRVAAAGKEADPGSPAYTSALLEQAAENISALEKVIRQSEEHRAAGLEAVREEIKILTKTMITLSRGENL